MTEEEALAYGIPPEQIRAALGHVATTPNAAASMALATVAPDPQLPGALGYIPFTGLGEGLAGLAHFGGTHLGNLGRRLAEYTGAPRSGTPSTESIMPDWMRTAGEHLEENRADIKTGLAKYSGGLLPEPDMTREGGVAADLIGSAVGTGIGPLPAAAIANVPRGLKTLTSLALAPREHIPRNAALNLGITGAQVASDEAFHPGSALATEVAEPSQTGTPPAAQTSLAQAQQPPPTPPPVDDDPLGLFKNSRKAGGSGSGTDSPFEEGNVGPTFTQQGNTETSVGESLAGLAITFGAVLGGRHLYKRGAAMTQAARDARINDPAYAARVNDYNNEVIKRGPGGGLGSQEEVTAPIPEGNIVHKTIVNTIDAVGNEAAKNQDMLRMTSDNPTATQRLTSQMGNLYDTRMQHNMVLEFTKSGIDHQTGMRIPSLADLADDVGRLENDRRTTWNEGVRSLSEIENRTNNLTTWMNANPGKRPTIADIRHDFIGKDNSELHGMANKMESDPQLKELADRYWMVPKGMVDIGNSSVYRFFDNNEARDLKTKRKYHVAEFDADGLLKHPFGPRDATAIAGQARGGIDPIVALTAHVEQMYPLFQLEQLKQQVYAHYQQFQARPGAPKFIVDVEHPIGPHTSYYPSGQDRIKNFEGIPRDPIVTIRNNGLKHVRIDEPHLRALMKGNSIGAARVYLDGLDLLKRGFQKGTTGSVSLLTGRAMPIRNALFTSTWSPVTAPRAGYSGLLDKRWQRMTGLPGNPLTRFLDMPLNIARLPFTDIQNLADKHTGNLASLLHPANNNVFNKNLRTMAGDAAVDSMQQAFQSRWERSAVKFAQERGISGQSSPIKTEAPGIVTGSEATKYGKERATGLRLDTARIAPRAYINGSWAYKEARIAGIRLHNAIGDAFNQISDLGHMQWLRTNMSHPMDRETLAYETRNIVGNPSRMGTSKYAQGAASWIPYANVSAQGIGRTARAIGANPISTPLTAAMGLGTLALIEILTHMRSGAHMDYLQNQLSLQQREANVTLALNDDPTKSTMLPLPQEARPLYAYMLDLVSKAINIIGARHDTDVFKAVWDGITHFLGSNITHSSMDAIIHGAVDVGDFVNAPPSVGREDWNAVIHGRGLVDAWHSSASGVNNPPPGQGYDAPLDSANGQVFERLLSNTFGAFAHTMMDSINDVPRYMGQGHSFTESMGMVGHDWLHGARDANPVGNNSVFEQQLRLSTNPPIAEALQPTLYALSKIKSAVNEGSEGFVGHGANQLPVPTREDKAISSDLLVRQMHIVTQGWKSRIDASMEPIKALKAQMQEVDKVGMDPTRKRAWMNDKTRDIADKYKLVEGYVADMNNALSNMAGKGLRVQDIDFSKDSSQFR